MAIVRVNPNLEAELTGSASSGGPLERVLGDIADEVAGRARTLARREYYRRGGYTRGIHAEHGLDEGGELVGRVVADDWKSHWAEWPPRQEHGRRGHILSRAAEEAGLRSLASPALGSFGGARRRRALPAPARRAIGGR